MRNTTISVVIGGMLGLFFIAAAFAGLSLLRPGWLRDVAESNGPPVSVATLVAIVDAGGQVPPVTPLPTDAGAVPTVAPLPTVPGPCRGPQEMTIALLGMDTRGDETNFRARTDAITLLHINFNTASASMLSIPRGGRTTLVQATTTCTSP